MLILVVASALCWNVPAFADSVSYVNRTADENGNVTSSDATQDCKVITDSSTTWSDGWYVVNSSVTIGSRVTVTGAVNLILCDGFTLTVNGGINVSSDKSLTIYGQSGDSGKLVISGVSTEAAGIGGGYQGDGGTITIIGGTVSADGGTHGAGSAEAELALAER